MAFLKVNYKEPVESTPVSSLFIIFPWVFQSLCNTVEAAHSCLHFGELSMCQLLSQTIVNIAILKHIVLHDYGLKENIYLLLNMLVQILVLSSYLGKHFHL